MPRVCHVIMSLQAHAYLRRFHKLEEFYGVVEVVVARSWDGLRRQNAEGDVALGVWQRRAIPVENRESLQSTQTESKKTTRRSTPMFFCVRSLMSLKSRSGQSPKPIIHPYE